MFAQDLKEWAWKVPTGWHGGSDACEFNLVLCWAETLNRKGGHCASDGHTLGISRQTCSLVMCMDADIQTDPDKPLLVRKIMKGK